MCPPPEFTGQSGGVSTDTVGFSRDIVGRDRDENIITISPDSPGNVIIIARDNTKFVLKEDHKVPDQLIQALQSGLVQPADIPGAVPLPPPKAAEAAEKSLVRFRHKDGGIAGSGVLLRGRFNIFYVLTCAHVIYEISGTRDGEIPEGSEFPVEFPFVTENEKIPAILEECWSSKVPFDAHRSDLSDIALLRVKKPPGTVPAQILENTSEASTEAIVYGFSQERPWDTHIPLKINRSNRFRFVIDNELLNRSSFSGGPLWRKDHAGIYGIVGTIYHDPKIRRQNVLAIPSEIFRDACGQLRPYGAHSETHAAFLYNVPLMPPHYVARREAFESAREALIKGSAPIVAIIGEPAIGYSQGLPGIGKTVLASALCRDRSVRLRFPGGIFWLERGSKVHVSELQSDLAKGLIGTTEPFATIQHGRHRLADLLKNASDTLIVLDNVTSLDDVKKFEFEGTGRRILFTTRAIDAKEQLKWILLPHFSPAEAQVFCSKYLNRLAVKLKSETTEQREGEIAENINPSAWRFLEHVELIPICFVLLCEVAHRMGWEELNRMLAEEPADAPWANFKPLYRIFRAVDISIRSLDERAKDLMRDLAVAFPRRPVTLSALCTIWKQKNVSRSEVNECLADLESRQLVQVGDLHQTDFGQLVQVGDLDQTVNIHHEIIREFIISTISDKDRRHQSIIKGYASVCGEDWPSITNDGYCYYAIPYHLFHAGQIDSVLKLMLNFKWLRKKIESCGIGGIDYVLEDYGLLGSSASAAEVPQWVDLVGRTLSLSSHVVRAKPQQLSYQLIGRLLLYIQYERHAEIGGLLKGCEEYAKGLASTPDGVAFVLRTPSLNPAGGRLLRVLAGPAAAVRSIAVSSDKPIRVAAGCDDGSVWVWDLESGRTEATWPIREGSEEFKQYIKHSGSVGAIAISHNGEIVVTGGSDRILRLWQVNARVCRACNRLDENEGLKDSDPRGKIVSLSIDNDASTIVCASTDGAVRIYTENFELLRAWWLPKSNELINLAVSILKNDDSARGFLAVAAYDDERVRYWHFGVNHWHDFYELKTELGEDECGWTTRIALRPDDGMTALAIYRRHQCRSDRATISPDETSVTARLVLSDLPERRHQTISWPITASVTALAIGSRETNIIAGSSDNELRVWRNRDPYPLANYSSEADWRQRIQSPTRAVAFTHDDASLALSAHSDGTVKVWDFRTESQLPSYPTPHRAPVKDLVISSTENYAISCSEDGLIKVWDVFSGKCRASSRPEHHRSVEAIAITNTDTLFSVSKDGTFRQWKLDDLLTVGTQDYDHSISKEMKIETASFFFEIFALLLFNDPNTSISFSMALLARYDKSIIIYDFKNGRQVFRDEPHTGSPVSAVAISEDGAWMAAGSWNSKLSLYRYSRQKGYEKFMDDDILNYHVRIQCIALIPRHNAPPGVICGLEDGHILFFDNFREGKYQMRRLLKEADLKSIRKMLVYNGGKKVLAGGDGGALIFCNTDKEYSRSFKMHDGPINCLAVTNDRPYAITGSDDGSLRVWDLGDVEDKANWSWCTGKDPPRARILSEFYSDGPINCVKLSSNGHIVAGGRDGAVHILELLGLSKRSR